MSLQIRAQLACDLAGIDRDRFNEAVARQDYKCAPAIQGRTRVFTIPQVITLAIYRLMTEDGMTTGKAGMIAAELDWYIRAIEEFRFDDSDHTINGVLLKEYFAEERKNGDLESVGVAVIKTKSGYEFKITAPSDELREKIEKIGVGGVASPFSMGWGGRFHVVPVVHQQNWRIATIREDIMRGIENYRNTLGQEDPIG